VRRVLNVAAFDEEMYTVGRTDVEVEESDELDDEGNPVEVSESFTMTLDVTDDNTEYDVTCVATSLNPDFVLARYRSEAMSVTCTTLETPEQVGDSSLVYVVCTTLFMLVAAFFY